MQPTTVASRAPAAPAGSAGPTPADSAHTAAAAQSEFVPVRGAAEHSTSAELMLVLAYILMWTLLLGFVYFGFRRQRSLAARIEHLERALGSVEESARKE